MYIPTLLVFFPNCVLFILAVDFFEEYVPCINNDDNDDDDDKEGVVFIDEAGVVLVDDM